MKNLENRKRIMARSMRLGHCICNAKKSCPCDIFQEQDLCPCAGESPAPKAGPVRLMSLVERTGCASKIDKATLGRVLHGLPFFDDPNVLVGAPAGDDAGVYRIRDDLALVQTVDVFSPLADDPYVFGQIAAANSLSDVYAMGGRPVTALSIVGFPVHTVPNDVLREILRGGIDKMNEAGVPVVGGHSINDVEVKAGFAVTGFVHPDKVFTNAKAEVGDCLILTKPLGTGILNFAGQIGRAPVGSLEAATRSMAALNDTASRLMIECGAHACTDITGFGLIGHLGSMAASSGVDLEIVWDDLPLLPGALECLAEGIISGAVERNRESSAACLAATDHLEPAMLDLCFDPQTSGGLLVAIPEAMAGNLLERLHAAGISDAAVIGRVLNSGKGCVSIQNRGRRTIPVANNGTKEKLAQETGMMGCCENGHQTTADSSNPQSGVSIAERKFLEFLQAAGVPGSLDAKTKQAIAIALSVLARCEPCVKSHIKKALGMGFSQEEIDEAAWLAIGFGGSPTMMFYREARKLG
jgi:selenide,water dikinase